MCAEILSFWPGWVYRPETSELEEAYSQVCLLEVYLTCQMEVESTASRPEVLSGSRSLSPLQCCTGQHLIYFGAQT